MSITPIQRVEAPSEDSAVRSAWKALALHRESDLKEIAIRDLFEDPARFGSFSRSSCGIMVDFSKTLMTDETFRLLISLARDVDLDHRRNEMFTGAPINVTEKRSVLHTALRRMDKCPVLVDGENVITKVQNVLERMEQFVEAVHSGEWTGHTGKRVEHVVNLGIGGSDLGPRMVCRALKSHATHGIQAHFVANVDGYDIEDVLERVDPETTLFIVASKSFGTQETMANAVAARRWLIDKLGSKDAVSRHFVALSTNVEAVTNFGIDKTKIFEFWNWVGGRYSLWSAIGLSIALTLGMDTFNALRQGAFTMDRHFADAPLEDNLPVILALTGIWHANFLGHATLAQIPYSEPLKLFPEFCQQLDMESNGKSVTRSGAPIQYQTAPVLWQGVGTLAQHSFFQHLHQGTQVVPVEFLAVAHVEEGIKGHHRMLMANCFAQSEALMRGRTPAEARQLLAERGFEASAAAELAPHMTFPGNRPSVTVLLDDLTPARLGSLIALYEHKVFVQGVIWDINSFDQFGVELGKILSRQLLEEGEEAENISGSTRGLVKAYNNGCRDDDRI